jgi:hypothetical protein
VDSEITRYGQRDAQVSWFWCFCVKSHFFFLYFSWVIPILVMLATFGLLSILRSR